jgi:Flp pilus assembly protein TadG
MTSHKSRARERGNALLEFAISVSTILLVLFGAIDLGRAAFAYDWVSDAARQATRFAMVRGQSCSGLSGGCPATTQNVSDYVNSIADGIDTSQVNVTTQCAVGATISSPPCAATANVTVRVQYTFKFLSPLAPSSWSMQSSSERVVEN